MKKTAALILAMALPVWAATESIELDTPFSFPVKFHATEHALFSSTSDFIDPTLPMANNIRNEMRVRAEHDRFSLGVHVSNFFSPDGTGGTNKPVNLEKKTLTFEDRNWTVSLGDSHHEFGRGIALSLYRDEVFGIDNTIEGGAARFISNKGDIDVGVFAGRLRSLTAPVALIPWENPLLNREVWMGGAQAKTKITDDTYLGAHYLLTLSRPLNTPQFNKRWHTAGAVFSAEGIAEHVDFYAESNVLHSQNALNGTEARPVGYGSFASITYSMLPWRFQIEAKDYRGYFFDFQRPTSLEEDIVTSLNNQDMSIVRTNISLSSNRVSFLVGDDRNAKTSMRHVVAQTTQTGPARTVWVARAGYRWLTGQADITHANISVKIPTWEGQTLELGYRKLYSNKNLHYAPTKEDRNYFDLTYSFSDKWNAGLGYEYLPTQTEQHYFNGNTKVAFSSDLLARASIGQTSGGPQCSGGICRTVPAYSGGMLDVSYVF